MFLPHLVEVGGEKHTVWFFEVQLTSIAEAEVYKTLNIIAF